MNAARKQSGCSPIYHMIGTEVCISVDFMSCPASKMWNE